MSLLQDIQREATSDEVPVSTVLRRAQTLAFRLQHEPLKTWTRKELGGYQVSDALPDYRRIGPGQLPVKGEFVSPAGILSNVPLSMSAVPDELKEIRDHLFQTLLLSGVAEYEALLASGQVEFTMPWLNHEVEAVRTIWPGLSSAGRRISPNTFAAVLDQVRNRLLEFSLEIEQENPDAGEAQPGTVPIPEATVTNIFSNTIYGGSNVFTGAGRDALVNVSHTQIDGAWPQLEAQLADWEVPGDEIRSLEVALRRDGDPGTELGPATQGWLGSLAAKLGSGSVALAEGVSVEMIVHLLAKTLGIG